MASQIPGKGAKYMVGFTDSEGTPHSGGSNYRINLPANIPAANFWSVTSYEAENASGLANGRPYPSLGSRDKPVQNADGSIDIDLGPTEAAINKSWKPGDIEKVIWPAATQNGQWHAAEAYRRREHGLLLHERSGSVAAHRAIHRVHRQSRPLQGRLVCHDHTCTSVGKNTPVCFPMGWL